MAKRRFSRSGRPRRGWSYADAATYGATFPAVPQPVGTTAPFILYAIKPTAGVQGTVQLNKADVSLRGRIQYTWNGFSLGGVYRLYWGVYLSTLDKAGLVTILNPADPAEAADEAWVRKPEFRTIFVPGSISVMQEIALICNTPRRRITDGHALVLAVRLQGPVAATLQGNLDCIASVQQVD